MTRLNTVRAVAAGALLLGSVAAAFAQDATPPDAAPPADMTAAPAAAAPAKKPVKMAKKKAAKPADPILGVWTGKAIQVGRAGGYALTLTLTAKGGTTEYPDLACGGTLTKIGAKGDDSFYVETIDKGAFDPGSSKGCLSGTITLVKSGDQMIWGWVGTFGGKPVVAYSTLTKSAPVQTQ